MRWFYRKPWYPERMSSSPIPSAAQPPMHPVNVTVNPLQLLWLQESGIDRLWGRPLAACAVADVSKKEPGPSRSEATQPHPPEGPAAAGVAVASPAVPEIGAAREPTVLASASAPGSTATARQALAQLREQMARPRGRSAQRGAADPQRGVNAQEMSVPPGAAAGAPVQTPPPVPDRSHPEAENAAGSSSLAVNTLNQQDANQQWLGLAQSIRQCTACGLSEHARQPVPGTGPIPARLMIIDQAPGARDEVSGEPLSGQAGRLLDNMLTAIGFDRESAFITDVVKCRPMVNRPPEPHEIEACATHLQQQLALVQPACLLLFGNAAQSILNTTQSIGQLRETPDLAIEVQGRRVPVVVTFHPNHLMANQAAKPLAWADLKRVRNMLQP